MMNYFTLMSYILTWAPKDPAEESDKAWMRILGEVMEDVSPVHTQILSTLTLLSNSLLSGQSLPPYLPLPEPYEMTRHLLRIPNDQAASASAAAAAEGLKPHSSGSSSSSSSSYSDSVAQGQATNDVEPEAWNLLDVRNMEQKGYTEFAVIQVCSMLVVGELAGLIKTMGNLVGTVDFSFRVEKNGEAGDTSDDSSSTSSAESYQIQRMGTFASRATGFNGSGGVGRTESQTTGGAKGKKE